MSAKIISILVRTFAVFSEKIVDVSVGPHEEAFVFVCVCVSVSDLSFMVMAYTPERLLTAENV